MLCKYFGIERPRCEGDNIALANAQKGVTSFYILDFNQGESKMCFDASQDDGSFGRLINHSKKYNCKPVKYIEKDPYSDVEKIHLIFVATTAISYGTELLWDYSDHSLSNRQVFPWLKY